ncbi:hypothetical protein ACWCOV_24855 [Kribbella sp. NPDC002412]
MCRTTSDEQIEGIGKEPIENQEEQMFTNDSVKAEVDYRKERLSRDFRKTRTTRTRRHLFGKKA